MMGCASRVATFPARHDAFVLVRTFVEDACAGAGAPRADALRLLLLIEELFTNTVEHGHGQDSDAPVRVALTVTPAAIAVEYRDTARPFDPFAASRPGGGAPASDADDLDARPVGGLGIRLVTTMAEDVGYARRDGCNCLSFRLSRRG